MADLTALRELCAWMRDAHVSYARVGELELRLDPLPPPTAPVAESPQPDDDADERHYLATLLHSVGGDPEPFLEAAKRLRARAA